VKLGQAPRAEPLVPGAVLAFAAVAPALAAALLALPEAQLSRLRGVLGPGMLLVLGAEADLPWADGAQYLGREPSAPELWLPCAVGPDVPASLLARALEQRFRTSGVLPPFAVSLQPPRVVPLHTEEPLARARLERWQEAQAT
jgi:hypothetical protein